MVVKAVTGAALEAEITQTGQGVAFGVGAARGKRFFTFVPRVQQAAFFNAENKDQAVDEAQELLKIGILTELTAVKCATQVIIGRMLDKTFAQNQQSFGYALAQALAR